MLEKAVYLRQALDRFVTLSPDLSTHKLSADEWQLAESLLMILMPFQRLSVRFESNMTSAEIDYVFFAYETMFNHLEDIQVTLRTRGRNARRNASIINAVKEAYEHLKHYYGNTTTSTYVYADAMILNPRCKLGIFEQESWADQSPNEYSQALRKRFEEGYCHQIGDSEVQLEEVLTRKRMHETAFTDDLDAFKANVRKRMQRAQGSGLSEFDNYISTLVEEVDVDQVLLWWKANANKYPRLSRMARDVLAVPPSGCSVEREFSISGRIATWQRNRLSPERISDSMIYKGALRMAGKWAQMPEMPETEMDGLTDAEIDEALLEHEEEIEEAASGEAQRIPKEWRDMWWKTNVVEVERWN